MSSWPSVLPGSACRIRSATVWSLALGLMVACGGGDDSPTTPSTPDPPAPPAPNVLPTARITLSLDAGVAPLAVTLDGSASSDPDGSLVTYAWTFGDGSSGTGEQLVHTYGDAGEFKVRLTVRDDRGGEATAHATVFVSSPPGPGANEVRGTVWFDRDLNGMQDGGETGLHRFAVLLDLDGDGARGLGEPVTFTAVDGSYSFAGLDASRAYTVTQLLPFGWINTTGGPAAVGAPRTAGAAAEVPLSGARIIGGEETPIDPFPFQVALMLGDFQFCGGTLLNSEYVLTAAHCIDDKVPLDVEILIGTHDLDIGGERAGAEAFRIHTGYDNTLDYDVALIRLARPLLHPRVYLQAPEQADLSRPGEVATVIGWGQLDDGSSPNTLRRVSIPIITNDECGKIAGAFFGSIGPRTLCAGADRLGKGPCFGDSGGPLMVPWLDSWLQVGIVSFGVNVDQCGNVPGAFSRVTELYDYIVGIARVEDAIAVPVDWSTGPVATVDFGNFH